MINNDTFVQVALGIKTNKYFNVQFMNAHPSAIAKTFA